MTDPRPGAVAVAPDRVAGRSFRTASGAIVLTTATVLPVFLTGALAVQIGGELSVGPAEIGLFVSLYFAAAAVAAVPVGALIERWGPGPTGRLALVGSATAMVLMAAVGRDRLSIALILICSAWCNVMGQLSTAVTLARTMPARRLGLSFGVKQASVPLATLLAGLTVPLLALTVGWRWAFVAGAVVALLSLGSAPRRGAVAVPERGAASDRATGALAVVGAAAGLGAASCTGLSTFLVASSVDRGVDPGLSGLVLTFGSVIALTVRVANGWLADRRGSGHIPVVAGCLATGAIGLGVLALPGSWALVVGTVLGFGLGWSWPGLLQFAVVRLNPVAPAAAASIVQVGVYAGGFMGPLGFGVLATHASFTAAWAVAAGSMALAAAGVLVGRSLLSRHARRAATR